MSSMILRLVILACTVLGLWTGECSAIIETEDEFASLRDYGWKKPPIFTGGISDFSLIFWIRRTSWEDGTLSSILDGESILWIGFDDEQDGVAFEFRGTPEDIGVLVPLRDSSRDAKVPVNEWMLVACSWNADERELTAWARSETAPLIGASDSVEDWVNNPPWPIRIGATAEHKCFTGQLGLLVFRNHQIDASDLDLIWSNGAPHHYSPALLEGGNMTGFEGVEWMICHGIVTTPNERVNPASTGSEVGAVLARHAMLVYNAGDYSDLYSTGYLGTLDGTWFYRSPHETGEDWSGFFVRDLPELDIQGPRYVQQVSPRARQLADAEPVGLIRVIASANSRASRLSSEFYDEDFENWSLGGLYRSRKSQIAGVIVPPCPASATWPGFRYTCRKIGTVNECVETPNPSVSFGNFGTNALTPSNPDYPNYAMAANALVIEDGSAIVPKAQPEPGTLFSESTTPLTVRAMALSFPGSGDVMIQGEKAAGQHSQSYSTDGDPAVVSLDTTQVIHELTVGDNLNSTELTLTLAGVIDGIEAGQGCYIKSGPGAGGISMVVDVEIIGVDATHITLEKWFPADPEVSTSVVHFGPVEPVWVGHQWAGLEPDDPEVYRGVRLTAEGGIVVVLALDCFNPETNGLVVGPVGQSGHGYDRQLMLLFSHRGIPFMRGLEADVWLQFLAHQASLPSSMAAYASAIRQASPTAEIWWCGDPDLDFGDQDSESTDQWQAYILDNATGQGVGAIVAHEHPNVGTGAERAGDGQCSDGHHLSARGCEIYLTAVLEIMQTAALPDDPPIPGDVNSDGVVDIDDLFTVLGAWGPCPDPPAECPEDVNGDDAVDINDVFAVLGNWT